LAAVAIPKLAATRDDADAAVCVQEIGQLVSEITAHYTKVGNRQFTNDNVSKMTNITTNSSATRGIKADGKVHGSTGITYKCDGVEIVSIKGNLINSDYFLDVTTKTGSSAASIKAINATKNNILNGNTTKRFKL